MFLPILNANGIASLGSARLGEDHGSNLVVSVGDNHGQAGGRREETGAVVYGRAESGKAEVTREKSEEIQAAARGTGAFYPAAGISPRRRVAARTMSGSTARPDRGRVLSDHYSRRALGYIIWKFLFLSGAEISECVQQSLRVDG